MERRDDSEKGRRWVRPRLKTLAEVASPEAIEKFRASLPEGHCRSVKHEFSLAGPWVEIRFHGGPWNNSPASPPEPAGDPDGETEEEEEP